MNSCSIKEYMKFLENYWAYILGGASVAVLTTSILASGKQESFYMKQESVNASITYYCVYADINWRTDQTIYCSEDFSKVLMLNMALTAQKSPTLPQPNPKTQTQ